MKKLAKKLLNKDSRILLRRLYFKGDKYYCSVCDNNVRSMFTAGYPFPVLKDLDVIGGESIAEDTCPICFSNSRARLLLEYLRRELSIEEPSFHGTVLHVAPEFGIFDRLRRNRNVVHIAVDINPNEYKADVGGIEYCDITAVGYQDEVFDLIICSHVLEHIPDDRQAIRELWRVLKPGGTAILQVPISGSLRQTVEDPYLTDPRERERRFGQHDHVRIYGADYSGRLREEGFRVEIFNPIKCWGEAVVEEMRLNRRETLYLGRK